MIFNKWGEMIFGVNVGWDGYVSGKLRGRRVCVETSATLSNGERIQQVGNVTLLAR